MRKTFFTDLREQRNKVRPVMEIADSVASIGERTYDTLEAALEAACKDDTITLLKETTMPTTVSIEKGLVLDLNGKKLSVIGTMLIAKATFTGKGVVHFD